MIRVRFDPSHPGSSMRVRVEGAPSSKKPSLVFIHGAGGSATLWLDLFRHFERSHHVVAPDLPAHGQSDPWHDVADADRIAQFADAVGVACAHAKTARAVLVGHSMGGLVALAAAHEHPDKVAGVVLVNAAPGLKASGDLLALLATRREHQAELVAELGWSPSTSRDVVERWTKSTVSAEPDVVSADFRSCGLFSASPIVQPTLLIGGADDVLCSPAFLAKRAGQMGAQHEIVPDAGHFVNLEKPAETIAAIERFLSFV